KDRKIQVLLNHRIAEADVRDRQIRRIMVEKVPADWANAPGHPDHIEEHIPIAAQVFIDCGYEGDLMAAAKVSYTVGREAVAKYGEPLNGIRAVTPKHQFGVPVDPYRKPGDASSGLIPLIQEGDGGTPGEGDHRVQTYNFRLCLTQDKAKWRPPQQAQNYDAGQFELMARYLAALTDAKKPINLGMLMKIDRLPGGKTDINNNGAV